MERGDRIIIDDPLAVAPQAPQPAKIHFKRFPKRGMHPLIPDGVYYTHGKMTDKRLVQIVQVGHAPFGPDVLQAAFNAKFSPNEPYGIVEFGIMAASGDATQQVKALSRGFFNVLLRKPGVTREELEVAFKAGERR